MLIGEISKKTNLSRDTIRFYEKKGLLKVDRSNSKYNNYKKYTERHVEQLLLIKNAKQFGFTLNEVAELMELMRLNLATCSTLQKKVNDKLIDIDKRILALTEMKQIILSSLSNSVNTCCANKETKNCKQLISRVKLIG